MNMTSFFVMAALYCTNFPQFKIAFSGAIKTLEHNNEPSETVSGDH